MTPPRDWDGASYDRVAVGVMALGHGVLARLELRGDETVLDAGCGSGQVTAMLAERLPRGRVIAVDGSPAMVDVARERLGERVEVRLVDLLELELEMRVDVVFSTAVFHWIGDHARLFERLHSALQPGGRLVAQCGGEGNIASVREAIDAVAARQPFAGALAGWAGPWNFSSPARARELLERAGFADVEAWLHDVPVMPEQPAEFLRTVLLSGHLERLDPGLRESFADAVAARLPRPLRLDYVRLNIEATA